MNNQFPSNSQPVVRPATNARGLVAGIDEAITGYPRPQFLASVGQGVPSVAPFKQQQQQQPSKKLVAKKPAKKSVPKGRKFRRNWTHQEDAALLRIVQNYTFQENGTGHWAAIANKLNTVTKLDNDRSGKQCRDRWQCHLRPDIKKGAWTAQEEHMILEMHASFGTKWSCMSKLMKNRTDNDIKNKWYSMMRKEKNAAAKKSQKSPTQPIIVDGTLPQIAEEKVLQFAEEKISQFADAPTPYNNESVPNQDFPSIQGSAHPECHPGEFYLLSTNAPSAAYGWSLSNPFGQSLAALYNPQLVTDYGSMVLVDGAGNGNGQSPYALDANPMPGLTFGSGADIKPYAHAANFVAAAHAPETISMPRIQVPNAVMSDVHVSEANTMAGVEAPESTDKFGSRGDHDHATLDIQAPEVVSIPSARRVQETKNATAKDFELDNNLEMMTGNLNLLAGVGLAGRSLTTPIVCRSRNDSADYVKDVTVPPLSSSSNVENATTSSANDVAMPLACGSTSNAADKGKHLA